MDESVARLCFPERKLAFTLIFRPLSTGFVVAWMSLAWPCMALPLNDNFNDASILEGISCFVTGSNVGASIESGEPQVITTDSTVWYAWQAPTSMPVNVYTDGSDFDTVLAVFTGESISQLVCVASNDDEDYSHSTSLVQFGALEGVTYYIQVGGYGDSVGAIQLSLICAGACVPNDNFSQARLLEGSYGRVTNTSLNATIEPDEPNVTQYYGGHSIWYHWVAPHAGNWAFTTDGSTFDTVMAVLTGGIVSNLVTLVFNDDSSESTRRSLVRFDASSNADYYISVDGYNRQSGDIVLNWGETPANDNFDSAGLLGTGTGVVYANNVAASSETGEPTSPGAHSVWYRWVAPDTGLWTFNTQLSDFDTWLGIYFGSGLSNLVLVASNDNVSGTSFTSSVVVTVTNGEPYYIGVYGAGSTLPDGSMNYSCGNIQLNWFSFAPQIFQVSMHSNEFGLSFWTTYGTNYITEWKTALTDPQWDMVTNCIGSGLATQMVDQISSRSQGFYRVRIE